MDKNQTRSIEKMELRDKQLINEHEEIENRMEATSESYMLIKHSVSEKALTLVSLANKDLVVIRKDMADNNTVTIDITTGNKTITLLTCIMNQGATEMRDSTNTDTK